MRPALSLDAWELMAWALDHGKHRLYARSFVVRNGAIVFCRGDKRPRDAGGLSLSICWPRNAGAPANGFVCFIYPAWDTPLLIPMVGTAVGPGTERHWRFLCPIRRTLEQVLFADHDSQLFVSRPAIGRQRPKSDFDHAMKTTEVIVEYQEKWGAFDERPPAMSELQFEMFWFAMDGWERDMLLASSGIPDLIEDVHGMIDVIAMSKEKQPSRRADAAAHGTYTRSRSGELKLSTRSKKLFGVR